MQRMNNAAPAGGDRSEHGHTLRSIYADWLAQSPDDSMIIEGEHRISVAQFDRLCAHAAGWMAVHGVGQGDKVAVWVVNRVEWLALLFGLARVGATLVAVNTRYRSHELHYILSNSQATMLVLQPSFHKIDFPEILCGIDPATLPDLTRVVEIDATDGPLNPILGRPVTALRLQECAPDNASCAPVDPDAPVVFFTTSGTTRGPKLVMHTQRTLSTHAHDVARAIGLGEPGDTLLTALPLCGVFGLNSVLGAMAGRTPVVMMDIFEDHEACRLMTRHRITHMFGSDEMLRRLIAAVPATEPHPVPFSHLRLFGAASFSPRFAELARELIPRGFPIRGLYGSSEVNALFSLQDAALPLEERVLGGGRPVGGPCAHVRARDPETGAICPHGVPGEIEIRSETQFAGYYKNPEATAQAFTPDGYFRTGDLGYTREDGSFVYLTRMGDTMRLGGFMVDPSEIEQTLAELDDVASAQVVGIEIEGRCRAVAFVIPEGNPPEPAVLIRALADRLAAFKVPARIWFVDAFPATASANGLKFQRAKMREQAITMLAAESAMKPVR